MLGDPASGKATQGKYLAAKYHLYDIDMGRILREIKEGSHHSKFAKQLIRTMDKGKLAPTKIVRGLLEESVQKASQKTGILFNGTPKMLGEAKLVKKLLEKYRPNQKTFVIYLHLSLAESLKRVRGKKRRRADDTLAGMQNRVRYYRKNIVEVTNFFKKYYDFEVVNGLGTRSEVKKRILVKLNEHTS